MLLFLFLFCHCAPTQSEQAGDDSSDSTETSTQTQNNDDNTHAADDKQTEDATSNGDETDSTDETAEEGDVVTDPSDPVDSTDETSPILFGFWGLNGYVSEVGLTDVQNRFHATVFQLASTAPHYTVTTLLPLVQSVGMHVTLRITGWHDYVDGSGNFDLTQWKDQLLAWQTACDVDGDCLQDFIDDGTLVGHMLIDDIFTFTGNNPTAEELDEMARYSEELFPGLMTFVRNKASTMPEPALGSYQYLDACVNQYTNYSGYSDGAIEDYVVEQASAADRLGLEVINGLNIADGGDGSSGVTGWGAGKYAMSASEITTYGEALLSRETFPNLKLFLMWEYDGEELWNDGVTIGSDYFDQSDLQEALVALGVLAADSQ